MVHPAQSHKSLLVTVVTPCYNSGAFIKDTVESVLGQSYSPIEYIVMDGGSRDHTLEVLKPYANQITIISEPDRGQSDAINKGWRMAKGDVLAWLNADDLYQPDSVQIAADYLSAHPDAGWVYGFAQVLDAAGRPMPFRYPNPEWSYQRLLNEAAIIVQPSVFIRRQIFEEFGALREDLHYCMDMEYWLRIGQKYPGHFEPRLRVLVKWYRETKSQSGGIERLDEVEAMVRSYGASGLPTALRHEWTEACLAQTMNELRHGRLAGAARMVGRAFRFPAAVPHGLAKALIRRAISPELETRLRRWFVRT